VYCAYNQLPTLDCPNATNIYCHKNPLQYIYAPKVEKLKYDVTFEEQNIVIKVPETVKLTDKDDDLVDYWDVKPIPQAKSARGPRIPVDETPAES
jgi:hypothetical protein